MTTEQANQLQFIYDKITTKDIDLKEFDFENCTTNTNSLPCNIGDLIMSMNQSGDQMIGFDVFATITIPSILSGTNCYMRLGIANSTTVSHNVPGGDKYYRLFCFPKF